MGWCFLIVTCANQINCLALALQFEAWGLSSASSSITAAGPPINQFDLGGMSPRSLARGLTYIQSEFYYDILTPDFVQWSQNILCRSGRNGVALFTTTFNQTGQWITWTVLDTSDLRRRAEIIEFFIHTASVCRPPGTVRDCSHMFMFPGMFVFGQLFVYGRDC